MQPIISIQNLSKYYGSTKVLSDISLDVNRGEIIGYIGPNGAGKSTTIKTLIGMLPDYFGQVQVLGMDIKTQAIEIKKQIGYVAENAALYEVLSPNEYLTFIGRLYLMEDAQILKRANDLLHIFELSDKADTRMNSFSKGMKQKVLLISGLIHNPELVFLDEPLSGLDANTVILVKEILQKLKTAGKTIFYSSHIMDVVEKISDRIVIINHGTIVANGTFEELKTGASGMASLEGIFTGLTGSNAETENRANDFITVMGQ